MIGAIHMTNRTRSEILKNSLLAVAGLLLFGLGVHLTIQANIGAAPWDAFSLGLSSTYWKVLAAICREEVPQTIEEKKAFLERSRIALWDVIGSCEIEGSSDASIRGVVPKIGRASCRERV